MIDYLKAIGIKDTAEVIHNPDYDTLYRDELSPELEGFARGQESELGAVNVLTGEYTGRSPKDKFIVMEDATRDTMWWTGDAVKNDNKPMTPEIWDEVKALCMDQLSGKKL